MPSPNLPAMGPGVKVYLIVDDSMRGVIQAKRWHDFSAEYLVWWDNGTQEWHTSATIARIPKSHRRNERSL